MGIDRIIFSFDGYLLGVLFVNNIEDPNLWDINFFAKTKGTYIIEKSATFCDLNHKAIEFGIKNYQFGKEIDTFTYNNIIQVCGGFCNEKNNPAFISTPAP
ncbi:MAG: hypothetical protein ACFFCS_02530 [Candidatus Hodarchaeota archaeon]